MDDSSIDFNRRFGGIARLYGQSALSRFGLAHIGVIGIGGVGSWAAEALARSAVGKITLIDLDNVAESNVNRQIHALSDQFGRAKVDAMADRIQGVNPFCEVSCIEEFVGSDNLDRLVTPALDFVIDCIDSYKTKAALIDHCRRQKIKLITIGGAGGQIDPLKLQLADLSRTQHDPLLSKTRKLLRKEYNFPRNLKRRFGVACVYSEEQPIYPGPDGEVRKEKPEGLRLAGLHCGGYGSAMTVTSTFGMVAVAYVLKRLASA